MEFLRPSVMDKSHSTLYSISTKSMASSSDSNNNDDDGADSGQCNGTGTGSESMPDRDDRDDDTSSDLSYNECDITLMDDDMPDAKNEAEVMFFQVVEMLRFEEVRQHLCFVI